MNRRVRLALFFPALAGLAALLLWSFAELPGFGDYRGPYGFVLNRIVVPERHTTNVVGAIVFDYRGIDTLGEEFILFASVLGVVLLLRRAGNDESEEQVRRETEHHIDSDAITAVGLLMVGGTILVGLWLAAFGYVTPGGGFQGGVAVAAGMLLLYLCSSHRAFAPVGNQEILDPLEALGAGGYVAVGIAALVGALPFLHNLSSPGKVGTLLSGGSIPLLNWATALEVATATVVLFSEFLGEYIVALARRQT